MEYAMDVYTQWWSVLVNGAYCTVLYGMAFML